MNETLSGPVAVCVDRPLLALDRPFTYDLSGDLEAGIGSLVQVPFHGRAVRAWVLGPTEDVPARMLEVRKVLSSVRFFDERLLAVLGWVSERYVAPLASVIVRSHPPRVVGEEVTGVVAGARASLRIRSASLRGTVAPWRGPAAVPWSTRYTHGEEMMAALRGSSGTYVVRPAPQEEIAVAVEAVRAALDGGRAAIVVVPEADPLPATARAVVEAFGDDVALFLGGDKRERYRTWLEIGAGRYRVVVGTRPTVFAPVPNLGLLLLSREHHVQHREERSPYYHVRDVAVERARVVGGVCVLSSVCPSLEAQAIEHVEVARRDRAWPPVEVVRPGPEGRAPRLVRALAGARRGFLFEPMRGYGVARVCRSCGEPAACAACGGVLRSERGSLRCTVCGAEGRCASCGAREFGIARGGAERVEEWARGVASVPVTLAADPPRPPAAGGEVLVGGLDAIKDFGAVRVDLVGILNADASLRRPGVAARERALAAWMEAGAWARPEARVIVQTAHPADAAVQALVTGRPERFARSEVQRLRDAGFAPGDPVFRVVGGPDLEAELAALGPRTLLATALGDETVCLLALDPDEVAAFGRTARRLAERGVLTRVEAEPHL